ncbi:hypothetical protein GGD38_007281 [Chitinophagaceae bacterium OAS944]|nr:hypothetical protein [Chitinophagaceae bacterium OAS944]
MSNEIRTHNKHVFFSLLMLIFSCVLHSTIEYGLWLPCYPVARMTGVILCARSRA